MELNTNLQTLPRVVRVIPAVIDVKKIAEELGTGLCAVNPLFLEVHIHPKFFQHSCIFQTVNGVSGESCDGFCDDHIHLALFTQAHQLIEFLTFLCACSRNAFIRKDADKFPFGIAVDFFGIYSLLDFVTVELFVQFSRHATVGGNS